jgi:RNA polymerase sigma-70 factor (ECF subfamily)
MLAFYMAALETDEERDKLADLYQRYHQLLTKAALRIVKSPDLAEDAVHETFVAAIEDKGKIIFDIRL